MLEDFDSGLPFVSTANEKCVLPRRGGEGRRGASLTGLLMTLPTCVVLVMLDVVAAAFRRARGGWTGVAVESGISIMED